MDHRIKSGGDESESSVTVAFHSSGAKTRRENGLSLRANGSSPMTSSAKQSNLRRRLDCSVAFAPRNDEDAKTRRAKGSDFLQTALVRGRAREKFHKRLAIVFCADGLFRHLGAGRVMRRSDLEQVGNGLLRPNDVELLQSEREIISRQRRDTTAENVPKRRARLLSLVGLKRVTGDAGAEDFGAVIAGILLERILRCANERRIDRLAGNGIPAADERVGATGQQRCIVGQERDRPHR